VAPRVRRRHKEPARDMTPKRQLTFSAVAAVLLGLLLLFSEWTGVSTFTLIVNVLLLLAFVANVYVAWNAWRRMQ
jgi:multisubunit Na+/H+ antiporter MnhF subunit